MPVRNKRDGKIILSDEIYVGRPSKWGNPFTIEDHGRSKCIDLHKKWLWNEIKEGKVILEDLAALHDRTLVCWCHPAPCHADTLLAAARWAVSEIEVRKA